MLYLFTAVWYQPVELHLTGKTSKPGKTRENNLTNEVAPRSEYEVGTGTPPLESGPDPGLLVLCSVGLCGKPCFFIH